MVKVKVWKVGLECFSVAWVCLQYILGVQSYPRLGSKKYPSPCSDPLMAIFVSEPLNGESEGEREREREWVRVERERESE